MAVTPPLEEVVRRIHERDTTLDLPAITLDLIERLRKLELRTEDLQNQVNSWRGEVNERDQRLNVMQARDSRQTSVIEILRERMKADLATHRLAQTVLDAFDSGAIVIPTQASSA